MVIILVKRNYPKRIGGYIIYKSRGQTIIRSINRFITKTLKTAEKYKKCRPNANEFGQIPSLCKKIRIVLKDILSKKNNLQVAILYKKKESG